MSNFAAGLLRPKGNSFQEITNVHPADIVSYFSLPTWDVQNPQLVLILECSGWVRFR